MYVLLCAGILRYLVECRRKYGPVFRVWMGLELNVLFNDPDDVRVSKPIEVKGLKQLNN